MTRIKERIDFSNSARHANSQHAFISSSEEGATKRRRRRFLRAKVIWEDQRRPVGGSSGCAGGGVVSDHLVVVDWLLDIISTVTSCRPVVRAVTLTALTASAAAAARAVPRRLRLALMNSRTGVVL